MAALDLLRAQPAVKITNVESFAVRIPAGPHPIRTPITTTPSPASTPMPASPAHRLSDARRISCALG
jgi:hypothetical protein